MTQYIKNFLRYKDLLRNLISRDIKVKYRRSVLGIGWSILNPLLMTLVITAVFSTVFKFDIPNFPIYYLTGSIVFNFFSEATTGAMGAVVYAGGLIKKVYIPKYIFPLEKILFAFINLLFSVIPVLLVLLFSDIQIKATILLAPIPLVLALVFAIGIGLVVATSAVFFRDIFHLYSVLLTAWMYLTPLFYPVSIVPEDLKFLIQINPLYYYIDYLRQVVMYGTIPDMQTQILCVVFALGALVIGTCLFKSKQDQFVLYI